MAAMGSAILFICSLVGTTIIGAAVLALAGRSFLVIVQDTAAGIDRIRWPEEALPDWLVDGARLAALLALWMVPAGILANALAKDLFPAAPGLGFVLIAFPGVWLYFPFGLLSAYSSESGWALFRPVIALRLLRLAPSLLAFYLLSALLAAVVVGVWYFFLFAGGWYLLPVAAVLAAVGVFVYARQLGRLAWLVSRLGPLRTRAPAKKAPPPRARPSRPRKRRKKVRAEAADPWAAPPDAPEPAPQPGPARGYPVIDPDADSVPYGLAPSEPPAPPPAPAAKKPAPAEEEDEPPPRMLPPETPERERGPLPEPSKVDEWLFIREPPGPPPALPLVTGVYNFPFYADSMRPLMWLAVAFFGLGLFLLMVVSLWMG